jgi:RNA polymerase sigma factor (sigma-70 family)
LNDFPEQNVDRLLRDLAPQVIAALARRHRDFAAAEDAAQEALIAAATQWPRDGVPDRPRSWLIRVGQRRLIDGIRSEASRRRLADAVAEDAATSVEPIDHDVAYDPEDTLVLLFMCCHPALTSGSAIALTLRAVGGLTSAQIARSFLVPELTIVRRISRAKERIRASGIPFAAPDAGQRAARLRSVLHVLYLVFNEGYTASSGRDLHRTDLSNEAIRLAREVRNLLPRDGDVAGLLALMLLTDARRAARTGTGGQLIPLDQQDRTLWDRHRIAEGVALADAALSMGAVGEYQLQAAIAAVHDEAARAEDTDWPQILALYDMLVQVAPGPVAELNRIVATAMVHGPHAAVALLAPLEADAHLRASHRLDAVRAHLLEQIGDRPGSATLFRRAASKTASLPERDYLLRKAAGLGVSSMAT